SLGAVFLDRARLRVKAGDGGKGAISFRREAHVPRGGPDGGDGGRGGSVVLRADPQVTTLSEFRSRKVLRAPSGGGGAGENRTGRSAQDLVIPVPLGTLITDAATGARIADLVAAGQELLLARGGIGGRGNARFTSSTRRAPRIAEDGQPGEEREVGLELKLIADVGLVGLPNAGKSSLLAALTRAHPKIADYPFTTLSPNLGLLRADDRDLVIADIPGLIEGAHHGAGLGEEFLRHVERTRLLVHVLDAAREDPLADMATVTAELSAYGGGLEGRPLLVALNKIDLPDARRRTADLAARVGAPALAISAATGEGVPELARTLFRMCPPRAVEEVVEAERRIEFARTAKDWHVVKEDAAFRVVGDRVERLASGIDWDSPDAAAYFQEFLVRTGIERALRAQGARDGDMVRVGKVELEWQERGGR
ncbi:MAG: GTPase ObgE, partial [Candidatus Limnocylindria bacterium]